MSGSPVIQAALKLLVARGGTCALTEIGQELRRLKIPYTGTLKNIFGATSPYYTLHHAKDVDWLQIKSSVSLASLRDIVNATPAALSPAQAKAAKKAAPQVKKAAAKASVTPPVSPFKFQPPSPLPTAPLGQSPLHTATSALPLSLTSATAVSVLPASPAPTSASPLPASPAPTIPMPASPAPTSPMPASPAAAGGDDGAYFWRRVTATEPDGEDSAVFDERVPQEARPATYALLGTLLSRDAQSQQVYLNTRDPFTGVLVGVQGAGKSYTMSTIVEACMINAPPISHLAHPLSTLVFHYDRDAANICELLTLTSPVQGSAVKSIPEMVVLVSSSVFFQKQALYARFPNCRVLPLLLDWKDLSGEMLKEIMGVGMAGDQLYVSVIMTILRRWQQRQHQPSYAEFLKELDENQEFSKQQSGPMKQRLQLLSSILRDAPENKELVPFSAPVLSLFKPGSFVIVDSSNPLVTQNEANSVFHVMLQMFINIPFDSGRLVVLDEAHKYLGKDHGELGKTLLECIRQMRHHGLRVIISTQDPSSLGESMLELSTFVVMHCFTAPSWFRHLESALPLPSQAFKDIQRFARFPGHALVYCARSSVRVETGGEDTALFPIHVRKRITADAGTSRRHNVPPTP